MSVETVLITLLEGEGLDVYGGAIPENKPLPAVVYQRISTPQIRTHVGVAMEYPRMQITIWGSKQKDVSDIAETINAVLDTNQINFKLATKENEFDITEVEPNLHRRILEYFIWTDVP